MPAPRGFLAATMELLRLRDGEVSVKSMSYRNSLCRKESCFSEEACSRGTDRHWHRIQLPFGHSRVARPPASCFIRGAFC